jgi:hypothetical protein
MSFSWPLDDVRNQRWDDLLEYIDTLASTTGRDAMSMLLCSVSEYPDVCHVIKRIVALGGDPSFEDHLTTPEDERIRFLDGGLSSGGSPLGCSIMGAAWHNRDTLDTTRCLISCGANVNGITSSGCSYTVVQSAIVFEQYEHLKLLLANGADPYQEYKYSEFDHPNAVDLASRDKYAMKILRPYRRK